jgi:hypothetical protein
MAALTITMHTDEEVVRTACVSTANQVVAALAAKYGFDVEEATRELNLGGLKIQRKRGAPAKKPVSKKTKDTDGKPKAKRAPTGYLLYQASVRPEVKASLEDELRIEAQERGDAPMKLQPQAIITAIAALWKGEAPEMRAAWNKEAKDKKAESEASASSSMEEESDFATEPRLEPAPEGMDEAFLNVQAVDDAESEEFDLGEE